MLKLNLLGASCPFAGWQRIRTARAATSLMLNVFLPVTGLSHTPSSRGRGFSVGVKMLMRALPRP